MLLVTHGGALEPVLLGEADHAPVGDIGHLLTLGPGGFGLPRLLRGPEVGGRHLENRQRMLGLSADWGQSLSLDGQCEATAGSGDNIEGKYFDFVKVFFCQTCCHQHLMPDTEYGVSPLEN